jgi:tetratricopeptide (TPR) repeat protein
MLNTAELETRVLHSEAIKHAASILQDYQETMTVLEQLRATDTHQSESAQAIRSFATLTLALASDKRGYFERTLQLSKSAIDHYLQAIRLFQELGRETDNLRAITMNNLSFLLSLQGRSEIGQQMAEKALQMSDQNGVLYSAALARNTLARILLDLDKVSEALHQVQQARRMLEEFGSTRGLAMCAFAEGEMRRWWAYQSRNTPVTSEEQYQQAIERYTEAQRIFDESQTELIRRIEARQGLGCAYRSRGFAKYQRGEDATADMAEAIRLFDEALSLYTAESSTPTPLITSLHEDIAVAYVNQERYTEALAALDEAQKSLPDSYTIREHEGIVDTEATREQKSYWLQLGQIELQRGICYHAQQDYHQFSAAMLRAFGCVLTFSPQAQQLFTIRSLIRPRLIDIDPLVLESIRYRTYKMANDLNLGEAFKEMDYLFDEAITFADVFQD